MLFCLVDDESDSASVPLKVMSQQFHMLLLWQSDENPGCAEGLVSTVETLHRERT